MKRYWKLISIVTAIVLVIGTFYIQSSLAASNNPEFVFEKVSGNEEEVETLAIYADYYVDGGPYNTMKVTSTGTAFESDRSFLERLDGMYQSPDINRLQEDYRNFMRGKTKDDTLFYEDGKVLAYADIKWENLYNYGPSADFTFDIEVLDKETNETTAIEFDVPNENNYGYIGVEDVQVITQKLIIMTRIHPSGSQAPTNETEIHVFTFDLTTKELVSDEMILAVPWEENSNNWTNIVSLNEPLNMDSQKYFVLKKEVIQEVESNMDNGVEVEVAEPNEAESVLFVYDYESCQFEELSFPSELKALLGRGTVTVKDSIMYLSDYTESGVEVIPFHIETEAMGTKQTFDLKIEEGLPFTKISNNKIYIVSVDSSQAMKETTLFVGDLNTGETLYEGNINIKDPTADQEDYQMYINNIEVE